MIPILITWEKCLLCSGDAVVLGVVAFASHPEIKYKQNKHDNKHTLHTVYYGS